MAQPETLRQSQRWDATKSVYLRQGLCHGCAAQAAWGHQQGFHEVRTPCQACSPTVATFPHRRTDKWSTLPPIT